MKRYANTKRREEEFQVGDIVFLKLLTYKQKYLVSCLNKKLATCFYGPYKVLERIEGFSYRLELRPPLFTLSSMYPN